MKLRPGVVGGAIGRSPHGTGRHLHELGWSPLRATAEAPVGALLAHEGPITRRGERNSGLRRVFGKKGEKWPALRRALVGTGRETGLSEVPRPLTRISSLLDAVVWRRRSW